MRILLLNHEYPPVGGGAGVAMEALARTLAGRGLCVDVVTAGPAPGCDSELVWNGRAAEEGLLSVHRVKCRSAGARGYLAAALPEVRRRLRVERYDVVHVFSSLPSGAMLPLLDLRGAPVVVSLRGPDVPGYDPHDAARRHAHRLLRPLTRWVWRRADRVVALSDSLGRLARLTLPGLRYGVVPDGVDLVRFRPRAGERAGAAPLRCLAVTPLAEQAGVGDLIRAVGSLECGSVELEIVGAGPCERTLRELAGTLGLGDRVRFTGALDPTELARRYRAADLFTLSSWDEASGNGVADAMASGLPIVAAGAGGIPELVRHGRNGLLVPAHDPAALAGAIRHLAGRPAQRAEMGRRNRADAEERLSWERVAARYLTIYNGVQRRLPARPLLAELPSSTW